MVPRRQISDDHLLPDQASLGTVIPARKTRQLPPAEYAGADVVYVEEEARRDVRGVSTTTRSVRPRTSQLPAQNEQALAVRAPRAPRTATLVEPAPPGRTSYEMARPGIFARNRHLWGIMFCVLVVVLVLSIFLSAGIMRRPMTSEMMPGDGGQVYSVQVGGDLANTWQNNEPIPPKTPIPAPTKAGPYSVMGKPTIKVDQINQVLAAYNSPATGKGQALYDLGVQYNLDPAFALAFFMHESTFGKNGIARESKSLGNLRCIPDHECKHNFAYFATWEDGFKSWFELIRNLYIAQWGRVTVEQIIPKYAPSVDNNNEAAYIHSVEHAVDVWRNGGIIVS